MSQSATQNDIVTTSHYSNQYVSMLPPSQIYMKNYQENEDEQSQSNINNGHKGSSIHTFNHLPVQQSESDDEILNNIDDYLAKGNRGQKNAQKPKNTHQNANQQNNFNKNAGNTKQRKLSQKQQAQQSKQFHQQSNQKMQPKQMLLNFKINELNKICLSLKEANQKLTEQLRYYQTKYQNEDQSKQKSQQSQFKNEQTYSLLNNQFQDQLTEMQGQFAQIQSIIQEYKQQLNNSEKKWKTFKQEKQEEAQTLKQEILKISELNQSLQKQIQEKDAQFQMINAKNQELYDEIDTLERQLYSKEENSSTSENIYSQYGGKNINHPYHYSNATKYYDRGLQQDYQFNEKIEKEMQIMIKKLMKELSHERKLNNRLNLQIKRLNNQVIQVERSIKTKNDKIYDLQMKILVMQRQISQHDNIDRTRNRAKHSLYINQQVQEQRNYHYEDYRPVCNQQRGRGVESRARSNQKPDGFTKPMKNMNLRNRNDVSNNQRQYRQNYYNDDSEDNSYSQVINNNHNHRRERQEARGNFKNSNHNNNNNRVYDVDYEFKRQQQQQKNQIVRNRRGKANKNIIPINNVSLTGKDNQTMSFVKPKKRVIAKMNKDQANSNSNHVVTSSSKVTEKSTAERKFISFSFMQLFNGDIKITTKHKIMIISKLIDLYCRKLKDNNYYNLIVQEIQVHNFNGKHPKLMKIKVIETGNNSQASDNQQEQTQESLLWNMAFIVESLLQQVEAIDGQDLEVDLQLSQIIEELLVKNVQEKISYFEELSKSLEMSVL